MVQLQPGDRLVLVLYTDEFRKLGTRAASAYRCSRSWKSLSENPGFSAEQLQCLILDQIVDFVGDLPQSDDITLMVLVRDLVA